ncbi:hypothetical protein GGR52DRAFT_573613 [Hypoxylon sp. FL1284]|nr:hypothetical protein GGR52DRAFT_573613 [Hypoxylon sp. FL1284]
MAVEPITAVTIRNFRSANCRSTNYVQCSRAPPWSCCSGGPSRTGTFSSSHFAGLPPTAIAAICKRKFGSNCGEVAQSGPGLNLCLNAGNCRGAFWMDCNYCNKRDNDLAVRDGVPDALKGASAKESVEPDVLAFDNHQFKIDNSVPEADRNKLNQLFEDDKTYDDIPQDLKKYELKGAQRRGDPLTEEDYNDTLYADE